MSTHSLLKPRHRAERASWPKSLSLRVHRALSWLDRAEQLASQDDLDGQFVFLWIAFNAAYATEIDEQHRASERQVFHAFVGKLAELDLARSRFEELAWSEFPRSIRLLLDNPYVHADFWKAQSGQLTREEFQARFGRANRAAHVALGRRDTVTVLSIVLARIYVLRNQLVHGGATWNGSVNRQQLRDCTNFMARFVPLVIEVMMDHPATLWGAECYPVVDA